MVAQLDAKQEATQALTSASSGAALADATAKLDALANALPNNALPYANRAMAHVRSKDACAALQDCDTCVARLQHWPIPVRPPMSRRNPPSLETPCLEDHTFVNPHVERKDWWLMKQTNCAWENLPPVPDEWVWERDASESMPDSWIAVRKKLTREQTETIKENLRILQGAANAKRVDGLQTAIEEAKLLLPKRTGPCEKAIKQAEEYCETLARAAEEVADLEQARRDRVAEEHATPVVAATAGFPAKHPVQRARRRLYTKVQLRRGAALELQGDVDAAVACLSSLRGEKHPEALEALARLRPVPCEEAEPAAEPSAAPAVHAEAAEEAELVETPADVVGLVEAGKKYIASGDFKAALEVLRYAEKRGDWEGRPLTRLRCLANLSLCLQKLRAGAELIAVCDGGVAEIRQLRTWPGQCLPGEAVAHVLLNKMECAILSRRGWAHHQLQHTAHGDADARRVKQLLEELGER